MSSATQTISGINVNGLNEEPDPHGRSNGCGREYRFHGERYGGEKYGFAHHHRGVLAASNGYLDISFSKGVYGSSNGVDPLNAGNLSLTFTQNGGNATDITITGARKPDAATQGSASALTGGETTVRVFLSISGIPSGVETIEIKPANGNPFYDQYGNPVALTQTTGVKTLNDKLAPALVSAVRTNNTHLTVTLSENCVNLTKANDGGFTVQRNRNRDNLCGNRHRSRRGCQLMWY